MKTVLTVTIIVFFGLTTCYGQANSIDFSKFRLSGLEYYSSKQAISKKFGKPKRVVEPDYECGFYSEREQGNKYYQLDYEHLKFIGNDKELYGIETMEFSSNGDKILEYGQWELSAKTTIKDFVKVFGKSALDKPYKHNNGETSITLFAKGADNGITFFFNSGHLVRIEHFSPC
ncbi:hypothetical protein [Pontibacter sp. H249]|uniref:hypothetical protein n=1 Tax=Pontibacter sp. H249 TaxID=3133420 RepID=UPI0030C1255B